MIYHISAFRYDRGKDEAVNRYGVRLLGVLLALLLLPGTPCAAADEEQSGERDYIREDLVEKEFSAGRTYVEHMGLLYVPDQCDEDTRFCLYFAGGGGTEDLLYYRGVYYYLETYQPNAVILFFYGSGFSQKDESCRLGARVLLHAAEELGLTLEELVTLGSSNGAYTALRAAAILYDEYQIPVRRVLILAAGMEWEYPVSEMLSDEQCALVAKERTLICLFEREKRDLRVPAILRMVKRGVHVALMACDNWDHNQISVNAYKNGLFSWAMGEYPRLDPEQYRGKFLVLPVTHRQHDLTRELQ